MFHKDECNRALEEVQQRADMYKNAIGNSSEEELQFLKEQYEDALNYSKYVIENPR